MLAVRVKFDRPLRRISQGSPRPVTVVETAKIPVPIPVQAPPPVPVPVAKPPENPEPAPAPVVVDDEAHREEMREMEERHRREFDSLHELLKKIAGTVEDAARKRTLQMNELQQAAVEIATTVATRLMHQEVTEGRFPIESMVRDMAGELGTDEPLTVYLHPSDHASLRERLGNADLLPGSSRTVRIAEDTNLPRGSCRLETPDAMLLGDMGGQLHSIRDELLRSLGHAAGT